MNKKQNRGFVDNALGTSEWFGAIIRYLFFLGKRKFNTIYNEKDFWKNVIVGYIFKVVGIIVLILLILNMYYI
ncbi:hypothetical protein [Tenacibaculum sp. M341]|uniref:hypothetical protein n=1 Tax=Tenacibaculum sp. M341 TaxID=2530339 RepID=UPI001050B2E1|nr:hypothetical protein [Tenacibaculum sp. M341]TCI90770.1 hypothetical protein EYW44_13695 [Tenacibaculum sp. M341]